MFAGHSVKYDERLRERALGVWEGSPHEKVLAENPHALLPTGKIDSRYTPVGGEVFGDFQERIAAFLDEVAPLAASKVVLLVTHNHWIRTAMYETGQIPLEDIRASQVQHLIPYALDYGNRA
jgi:alpha-ribazole phosphatase